MNSTLEFSKTARTLVEQRLCSGNIVAFIVPTSSMYPALTPGDRLIVQNRLDSSPRLGDIVLIQSDSQWISHRLIGRGHQDKQILNITKGDHSLTADMPVSTAQLRGVVIMIQRGNRSTTMESFRARQLNLGIAYLSHGQMALGKIRNKFLRRFLIKSNRLLLRTIEFFRAWSEK